jgi:hypothetical protein
MPQVFAGHLLSESRRADPQNPAEDPQNPAKSYPTG